MSSSNDNKQLSKIEKDIQAIEQKRHKLIDDNGSPHHYILESYKRIIFAQEFLLFIKSRHDFELSGWWNNWDLTQPIDGNKPINRGWTHVKTYG